MTDGIYICPVCSGRLFDNSKSLLCKNGHCFDKAKKGYVNLLCGRRSGDEIGDNADMTHSRTAFLSKGYFGILAEGICSSARSYGLSAGTAADICCGEGYYSDYFIKHNPGVDVFGFDISKNMINAAASRKNCVNYCVANMTRIPYESGSINFAFQLFSPFCDSEFSRIMHKDGIFLSVVAGERHLWELKEFLYDTPYKNDEAPPSCPSFSIMKKHRLTQKIFLDSNEDIMSLVRMTPYFYHTPSEALASLSGLESFETTVDFCVFEMRVK